ncbi:MAG: porin [Deltaproteobacteria bacterium]|nr:porin [Deltaproteobacteria bacterium]MBS1216628.1 porin [Pseudomonadota bacterium]
MGASRARFALPVGVLLSGAALTAVWSAAAAEPGREAAGEAASGDPRREKPPETDSESLLTRATLTGDWGGLRTSLAEHGLTLGLIHTADVIGIASGGLHRRAEWLNDWDLTLTAETEPLLGWRGGKLFLYGLGLWSTGSPSENAGDIQTLDNIDAPDEWKLYEAWLEQEMFGGRLSLLAGLYDVNEEFDVLETATLLINSSFGVGKDFSQSGENGPSIFPSTSLGVRIAAQPVANGYVRAAVLDGVPSDSSDSDTIPDFFDFDSDEGVLGVAEAGYIAGSEEGSDEKYTKIGLGGWYYSADFDCIGNVGADGTARRQTGNFGVYLLGERTVYREPQAPERGLAAFARVGFADSDVNPVGFYAGAGAVYTGLIRGRPDDRLGLGVAAAFAGHEFEREGEETGVAVDGAEVTIELTYRARLTPWLALQPDLQYIVNPSFDPGVEDALALGARFEVAF